MSLIAQKISGCYRRVLLFLIILLMVGVGIGAIGYYSIGGIEGLRYWMATRAVKGTEKLLLGNRPDGIPKETIETQFQDVYDAIDNRQLDLKTLFSLLKSYQERFNNPSLTPKENEPSTPDVNKFLTDLGETIFAEE